MDPLRRQYERFPYPPIPWFALPAAGARQESSLNRGIRILVAGCGTLEALAIAQSYPRAAEIVALDFSGASLSRLKRRIALARISGRNIAPVRLIEADLLEYRGGPFQLIFASNVLHHLADPAEGLRVLADSLAIGGKMRVVTYPRHSRLWMRATGSWLRANGLSEESPGLVRAAAKKLKELPADHPFRSCFDSQPETKRAAGLIDAFFNARETPLSPLEWESAARAAGLELQSEEHTESSRSDFLSTILPPTQMLSRWERLQVLDDLLELCANPALWFEKKEPASAGEPPKSADAATRSDGTLEGALSEAGEGLRRALGVLGRAGVSADLLRSTLQREVGPRFTSSGRPLPGLSLLDYDWAEWI